MPITVGNDSSKTRRELVVNGKSFFYYSLDAAEEAGMGNFAKLPASLKVVLENILRFEDGKTVEVEFMNAFFPPKRMTYRIINFGYLKDSRLDKVKQATYQQDTTLFLNFERNAFVHPEHKEILKRVFNG